MSELMLDTDISSYIIKRRPGTMLDKFQKHADSLCVSAITAAELRFGAEKAGRATLVDLVEGYLERVTILDWSVSVCVHYARLRAALERAAKPIGNLDLLIAAHALSLRATLITNNVKHFAMVPGLKIEAWA
jgi:tRNA(fMet)-specific endonuclease VapC